MDINPVLTLINKTRGLGSADQDYVLMYAIARGFQVERVLEIGMHKGASAITFCQAVLDNGQIPQIWTIDNWQSSDCKQVAADNLASAEMDRYVTMVDGNSLDVVPPLLQRIRAVDLCFIDGDHTTQGVLTDYHCCKDYSPLLLFHDSSDKGVKTALENVKQDGWQVIGFPTRYVEGNGCDVGITLAIRP